MENLGLGILSALLGIGMVVLAVLTHRASRTRQSLRHAYLGDCAGLFDNARLAAIPGRFPRLNGHYRGHLFDIQAVPDTLTFRKLPALWVLVTLPAPLPLRATLDFMVRSTGIEPFSNFQTLPDQIAPPPGFPEDCRLRTDDPTELPPQSVLIPHAAIFDDPRVKELVLSPKGLRITFLAEEANRGRYLIFRDAELGAVPLPRRDLVAHLDALVSLKADILDLEAAPERKSA
ncbi:hypothetical protein [Defluviimonas sp. SAOS-178_SWC]|uniref:hypothetical protein n=1 Tax=Defluviimonas sp. SAOS-178_SWC TaxID=3121287 RepID=UPI0032217510